MRADAESLKTEIADSVALLRRHLDWDAAVVRLAELDARSEDPELWNKADEAQAVMRERNRLAAQVEGVQRLEKDVADALELIELAEAEGDGGTADAAVSDLKALAAEAKRREIESLLSGEADANDCYVEVNSGAGGQHVNKTESGVRFTHIPTGIVVASTQDRSQHRNRAIAMEMLKARLYELELSKREAINAATEAGKTDIGWGHQIRSYVLQPYQMVKDLRTSVEKGNPDAVLDGDLDEFMAAALALRVGATRSEASAKAE